MELSAQALENQSFIDENFNKKPIRKSFFNFEDRLSIN